MWEHLANKVGREIAGAKSLACCDRAEKRDILSDARDVESVERVAEPLDRRVTVFAVSDQLGDHRVVIEADLGALEHTGINPDALALRRAIAHQPPDRRQEIPRRVLGIDPCLDRPAILPHIRLRKRQRLAGGDADHQLDQIEPGDQLRHRMLDL